MILPQVLLTFLVVWGITHAWQFHGERVNPGFANTEFHFYLHCTRLLSIAGAALSFLAVIWFAPSILRALIHATCSLQ